MTFIFALLFAACYMAPAIMAWQNKRPDAWAITIFNLLLGWSVIGWLVAAFMARKQKIEAN